MSDTIDINKITQLCKSGESFTLEFKASTANLRSAFETICAFLNGKGGTVLIGVKDSGQIIGQTINPKQIKCHNTAMNNY